MEYLARVNPKYFAAIQLYAAAHDVRFYLNGVRIEPHPEQGVVIVATDGHTLAAIHDPEGFCLKPIVVGDISRPLLAACKSRGRSSALSVPAELWIGENCAVVAGSITVHQEKETTPPDPFAVNVLHASKISLIDPSRYPLWRKVLRVDPVELGTTPLPGFQSKYLARLQEAAHVLIGAKRFAGAHLHPTTEHGVVLARLSGCPEIAARFLAAIMPIKGDSHAELVPTCLMTEKPYSV